MQTCSQGKRREARVNAYVDGHDESPFWKEVWDLLCLTPEHSERMELEQSHTV